MKKFINGLNYLQVSFISGVVAVTIFMILYFSWSEAIIKSENGLIILVFLNFIVYCGYKVTYMFFDGENKKKHWDMAKIRDSAIAELSLIEDTFVEVYFKPEIAIYKNHPIYFPEIEMLLYFIENYGTRFWLKLNKNQSATLICKDRSGNLLYEKELDDWLYIAVEFRGNP